MLILVPTPIGNLQDITLRAIEVLKNADVVLAEDTRTSGILLKHLQVQTPLRAYHQHNEHKVLQSLVDDLAGGKTMALITDAGTPGISDPGFLLVRACVQQGIPVECLPGPTAFVPALVVSGFPINRFVYEGFLPLKKGRHTLFTQWQQEARAIVFYESPVRLLKTLREISNYLPPKRHVCVCREISKKFEEHRRGTFAEVVAHFETHTLKGEIVVVIAPND